MNKLSNYVKERIQLGLTKSQIQDELTAVGWSKEESETAYRDALTQLGIPLPNEMNQTRQGKQASTIDVVINFFSFILLGIIAFSLSSLYFEIINSIFPDPKSIIYGNNYPHVSESILYSIASLIIALPLYFLTVRHLFRRFNNNEPLQESSLTKWVTYIVLLVASITIVGNLITILFMLLQGEFSVRFLLKATTILTISGLIFGFYYAERKLIQYRKDINHSIFKFLGWSLTLLVSLGIAIGFFTAGSPTEARNFAFDQQRANHLGQLSRCIQGYSQEFSQLPSSLDELIKANQFSHCRNFMNDPETHQLYEYNIIATSIQKEKTVLGEFELCAKFALNSTSSSQNTTYLGKLNFIWEDHNDGRSCDSVQVKLGKTTKE